MIYKIKYLILFFIYKSYVSLRFFSVSFTTTYYLNQNKNKCKCVFKFNYILIFDFILSLTTSR